MPKKPTKPKACATAVVLFDATKPVDIYECIDPDSGNPFYAGQTVNILNRGSAHDNSKYKINEIMKLKNVRFRDVVRIVPELPNGCHADHADEMEAYIIFNRKTIYDPVSNPMGCNSRIGNNGTAMTPARYEELKQMFATTGYQWPEEKCAPPEEVPDDLATARGVEKVIGAFIEDAKADDDQEVVGILMAHYNLAVRERFGLEKLFYGVREFAEIVVKEYRGIHVDAVNLNALNSQLNGIKEKLTGDPELGDLAGVITALGLVAHPDKNRKVSSTAAASFLEGVVAMIATREEETLVWTNETVKTRIFALRSWTRSNKMVIPKQSSNDAIEKSFKVFLVDWKSSGRHYGGAFTDRKSALLVMRDVPWFSDYVGYSERNKEDWKSLNTQLLDGFGWHTEPEFEGKKTIRSENGNRRVYYKLSNLVDIGTGRPKDVDVALRGLPEAREQWYRKQIESKRNEALAQFKLRDEAKRKRKIDAECGAAESINDDEGEPMDGIETSESGDDEDGDEE